MNLLDEGKKKKIQDECFSVSFYEVFSLPLIISISQI